MPVSGLTTFTAGTVIDPAAMNANFNAIAAKFNAGIVAADVNAAAGIGLSQLAASRQSRDLTIRITPQQLPGLTWPGTTTLVAAVPFFDDTAGVWTATRVTWYCSNYGGKAGVFQVRFVNTLLGVLSNPITVASNLGITNNTGDSGAINVAMTFAAARNCIIVEGTTADATTMNNALNYMDVVVTLQRTIF